MRPSTALPRIGRVAITAALAAAGISVVLANRSIRSVEAVLGAAITGVATGTDTVSVWETHSFYWSAGTSEMFGLRVSSECTAAFILGPLLIVAAAFSIGRRISLRRLAAGTGAVVILVLVMNTLRLGLVGWATQRYGTDPGYRWSHTIGGSMVSVIGLVIACVVFVAVTFRGRPPSTEDGVTADEVLR
jgi:exosortase/archaeosortase family protein